MDVGLLDGLPAKVRQQLRDRGTDLGLLAALVDARPGEPVLLTGSYASGEANPTSDFDLLVLTRAARPVRMPGAVNHPSILGDSFDSRVGDLVVNVEYVTEQRLDDLGYIIGSATRENQISLPNLQGLEYRLVQRVTTGIALAGADRVRQLRAALDAEGVRAAGAALAFVGALSLLEDTTVLTSPARELMHRGAAESLLVSAINAFGPITYDAKHLVSRATALAGQPGAPRLFAELDRLIFVDRLPYADGLSLVLDLAEDLYRSFTGGRCPPLIVPMLGSFRSSWAWSGRAF